MASIEPEQRGVSSETAHPASHPSLPGAARYVATWAVITAPLGIAVGSACALFLWSLEVVTRVFQQTPWLLWLLPAAGVGVGWLYHRYGRSVEKGSHLILDEIHTPGGGVPARIVPLVLVGTLVTHLFGGSAGREGTAVQMGGGIAGAYAMWARRLRARLGGAARWPARIDVRTILMTGVAAGFGGVFGTPVAGAVFALEALTLGTVRFGAVLPCLMAGVVADYACGAWGVHHTAYHVAWVVFEWGLAWKVAAASVAFGLAARLFVELAHATSAGLARHVSVPYLRPAIGAGVVIALTLLLGTRDYLGLGVTSLDPHAVTIVSAFHEGGADTWSWLAKIVFTVATVASGFKGGEVTPLFFVGATLGNTLARGLHAPADLMAGLGFVAVFAAAAKTPLACAVMAVELFGIHDGSMTYVAIACFVAATFSGGAGIYRSERRGEHALPE